MSMPPEESAPAPPNRMVPTSLPVSSSRTSKQLDLKSSECLNNKRIRFAPPNLKTDGTGILRPKCGRDFDTERNSDSWCFLATLQMGELTLGQRRGFVLLTLEATKGGLTSALPFHFPNRRSSAGTPKIAGTEPIDLVTWIVTLTFAERRQRRTGPPWASLEENTH